MKIIKCNGTIKEEATQDTVSLTQDIVSLKPCDAQYALIKRVVAREEKTFFYPYNGNEVLNTHPYWYCGQCGKSLKAQIPVEILYE